MEAGHVSDNERFAVDEILGNKLDVGCVRNHLLHHISRDEIDRGNTAGSLLIVKMSSFHAPIQDLAPQLDHGFDLSPRSLSLKLRDPNKLAILYVFASVAICKLMQTVDLVLLAVCDQDGNESTTAIGFSSINVSEIECKKCDD